MSAAPAFVHLHVHSEFSLLDSVLRVKPLVDAVRAADMPAMALTERCNLFSLVKFFRAALGAGVKPVIGAEIGLAEEEGCAAASLVLLCQNVEGYRSLARLLSRAYREGQARGEPLVRREWVEAESEHLIALSAGLAGDVGQALAAGNRGRARAFAEHWRTHFPDRYYLELTRTGRPGEESHVAAAVELAAELDLPVVATNDVRFLSADDFEAHEARVCIQEGRTLADPRREHRYSAEQYLRTPAEMAELFRDLPEALANSVEIARRCSVDLELGKNYLPDFPVPDGVTLEQWLGEEAGRGLEKRLQAIRARPGSPQPVVADYDARLQRELGVINPMGFAGYFLIVADFIRWARENGVPVGPGRGSGAGSLVAYSLGITDLDPIEFDLLFERFLNPERVSLPDFDIDFCMDGRDRVIEYVSQRYGADRVSQIITFGTMAAKAVVRDVGRVLGHPYSFVDLLAKLIPFEIGITLDKALAQEEALRERYEQEEEVRLLIDLARKLEGLARNAGKHAGGVVIAPSDLTDFTALYCEQPGASPVTQLDKDDVEAVGLVKFDFLGLRTLTIIDRALVHINTAREARGEAPVVLDLLPSDDAASFALIQRAATTAVFQLESRGMKELIRRLQPDCFEDVIALVALFRPGPLQSGMVDDFIDRKHGRAQFEYLHPALADILRPTYGVILYQEQVMQIAQELAAYTLGGADLLRRAMGKKKPEEMAKQRSIFVDGARSCEVDEGVATHIFDLMEKFAGYGFNKSHSAAYALVAYQTAWLKAHYPAAFMAAVLSADMDTTDKVVTLIDECRQMKLEVPPPDVNHCDHAFTPDGDRAIRYGLGAIKGVGQSAIDAVIAERTAGGEFADLFDFCRRVDSRRVNRRVIEALIRSGAADRLGPSRAAMMSSLTHALQAAEQLERDRDAGQSDMFGAEPEASPAAAEFSPVPEWPEDERLAGEKETLGLYLTGHPISRYESELGGIVSMRLAVLKPAAGATRTVAGLVMNMRTMNSRRGRMAVLTLDDRTGRVEAVVYSDVFQAYQQLLARYRLLVLEGEVSADDFSGGCSISVQRVFDLSTAREHFARQLLVRLQGSAFSNGNGAPPMAHRLAEVLTPFRDGRVPVCVEYERDGALLRLPLGADWRVSPSDELLARLRELVGEERVQVVYAQG